MPASKYLKSPGVLFAEIGDGWAAFSPLSGETHLLNNETIAIVETLDESEPRSSVEVAERLADDSGTSVEDLVELLADTWGVLLESGLVRLHGVTACRLS